jgi:hypothetical protein
VFLSRRNRDISVGIANGYGLDGRGSLLGMGHILVPIPQRPDGHLGPHAISWSGYKKHSPWRINCQERESDS